MIEERISEVIEILCGAQADAGKFDAGNASAGTRIRKSAQDAVHALKDLRKTVSEVKNDRKNQ